MERVPPPKPSPWAPALEAWSGPVAGGLAALAVFAAALWMLDVGPGGGMGGEVAAAAVEFRPAHAPGHAVHLGLAKVAALVPVGSIGFRVRVLSALLLGIAASFVASAALRIIRVLAGPGGPAHAVAAAAIGTLAGLTGPALATVSSADTYAVQALLGTATLWGAVGACLGDAGTPAQATGGLVFAAFAAGLAAVNHLPSGLPLVPPLVLAAALTLARGPRAAGLHGESPVAARVSWIVAGFAVGAVALLALPLRAGTLSDPATLVRTLLSRAAVTSMEADGVSGSWLPVARVPALLFGAMGTAAFLVAGVSLGGAAFVARTRTAGFALLGFVVGPAVVRAGLGFDRAPEDVAAYLAVPAMALALAFAVPAGLAIRAARADANWRRRVGWGALLVLLAAALVRHEVRRVEPAAAAARGRATLLAADALREPPPPGAALIVGRSACAALVAYDEAVLARRPDLALLLVPRLADADYARERIASDPDLAPLVSTYLAPEAPSVALSAAAERLASRRPLLAEPGRLTAPLAPRSLFPRGPLIEILAQSLGRTEVAATLAVTLDDPTRLDGRETPLAGSPLGAALAWDLARSALLAARIGAVMTPQPGETALDARMQILAEAAWLAREATRLGAPAAPIERLLGALSMVPGPDPARLESLLDR